MSQTQPAPLPDYEDEPTGGASLARWVGLFTGLALSGGLLAWGPQGGLSVEAWRILCILALMIVWWVTEAIPVAATALLPLVLLPLSGAAKPVEAAAAYADPIIFLFIGGFMIAAAVERWGLHRRIALFVLGRTGGSPGAVVGGFMVATLVLSMWISNTATAMMMMPIALAVARAAAPEGEERRRLMAACALGVAWCASIGGLGTPVGSPTNLIGMRWLEANGVGLDFAQWIAIGGTVILLCGPIAWFILVKLAFRLPQTLSGGTGREVIAAEARALGPMTAAEGRVLAVFTTVALAWVFRVPLTKLPGLEGVSDMMIAVAGAIALFLIPAGKDPAARGRSLLDWSVAEKIPWGITILFGGGLSIAGAMEDAGVAEVAGQALGGLGALPIWLLVLLLVFGTVFVSELASNVATLTAMLPVLGAVVLATGADPLIVGAAATFAASFGFMLPVATAANAIAYATGAPKQAEMLRWGLVMNLSGIVVIAAAVAVIGPLVRG